MDFNSEQKKAIEHGEGPLLIIAGAGTGKTRVITSRILHLMNSGAARSDEVLALTFTEKAANEMVERVDLQMPLGYEELCIRTFHAFCDQILRESGLEIGLDPGFKILTQVDQWFFFKKNLFEFELDYYRPLGNPNRFIYAILNHFSKLRDEMVDDEKYLKYAEGLEGEEKEKHLELAGAYIKYQELKHRHNALDFGDLCYYCNELLDKRESVLKKYQERFKYVLVDEFQDTNYAQLSLLLKLVGEKQNLTVVGDDDQSIYKWRGASLSNILQFKDHFPATKTVVLTENYRSASNILEASYELVKNNNPDRLEAKMGLNKKLNCNVVGEDKVQVHHFTDFISESSYVAKRIEELKDAGCEYGDVAILVRANSLAYPFIDELKSRSIPYQVKSPKGLFSLEEIKDLLGVIRVVANPYDDVSLMRVLKMDFFAVEMTEILEVLHLSGNRPIFSCIEPQEQTIPGIESGLTRAHNLIQDLVEFSKKASIGAVMNEFLNRSGYLHQLVEQERFEELDNINEFAKQVSKFERENEDNSVLDFINYLDLLDEANAVFSTEGFSDRNSVQILTVHGSKGLEFDHVFVVDLVKGRFPSVRRSDPIELPEELTPEIYPEGDFHIQEERRLMYVAMTRARRQLYLTYSDSYEGSKKWKASPFIDEVLKTSAVQRIEHEEVEDAIKRLKEFKEPAKPIFELPPFESKKLSYSQFDTFSTCPLKYNYRYVMKVPTPSSHAASFGTSIHETLKDFYRALKKGQSASLELMNELYEKNWVPYGYESIEHEVEGKKKGREMLMRYFEANSNPWLVPAFIEKNFNIRIGDYWIMGRIDRIDRLSDGSYEVIDYKTGKKPSSSSSLAKDLQLSIYALACRDVYKIPVSSLSLYYLNDLEKISTTRTDADLETIEEQVNSLIREIQNSKFSPTPGFHCQFCDFKLLCPAV